MSGEGHPVDCPDFTVPNAEGLAAMHQGERDRKRQRDLGLCCDGDLCERDEIEAEALKGALDE